jgi:hypothetical protein
MILVVPPSQMKANSRSHAEGQFNSVQRQSIVMHFPLEPNSVNIGAELIRDCEFFSGDGALSKLLRGEFTMLFFLAFN